MILDILGKKCLFHIQNKLVPVKEESLFQEHSLKESLNEPISSLYC